jgi:hypothetical protein
MNTPLFKNGSSSHQRQHTKKLDFWWLQGRLIDGIFQNRNLSKWYQGNQTVVGVGLRKHSKRICADLAQRISYGYLNIYLD